MDKKVPRSDIIETEIPMGTVHPAELEQIPQIFSVSAFAF